MCSGKRMEDREMTELYQGIPRGEIPWFPIVNPELCDNCLKCLEFCPHDVYEEAEGKLDVARPLNCPVGCSRCQSVCPQNAIYFMERRDLNMLLQQLRRQRAGM
jgi:NAD-dependent dihydropyrimidine dehydrogenase PreA subunit